MLTLFWTTSHPYDPVFDWRDWLETVVGKETVDWHWEHFDVVSGDTDELTVIALHFLNQEAELVFRLSQNYKEYDYPGYRNTW